MTFFSPSARILPSCLALFLFLAFPSNAQGEEDEGVRARTLITKGNVALRNEDEVLARKYYSESFELEESFDAVCNLGGTEARSKLYPEAYEHLQICLQIYPADSDLAETRQKIVAVRDVVRAELTDDEARKIDIRVVEYLEGRKRRDSETAVQGPQITEPVSKDSDQARPAESSLRLPVTLGLGFAGLVGVGVGVGFQVKAGKHNSNADQLREEITDDDGGSCAGVDVDSRCAELAGEVDKTQSAQVVRTVGFVAGGALLAGAVATYFLWPKPTSQAGAAFQPVLGFAGLRNVTLGLRGTF